jgi:integrase/recombinase XerD
MEVGEMTTDLLAAYKADMHSRNLTDTTARHYYYAMQKFAKFLQSRGVALDAVSRVDLKAYLDSINDRGYSHQTATFHFAAINGFYDFLVFEEMLSINPVAAVKKRYLQTCKNQHGHTHQLISVEQAAALIEEMMDIRNQALLILLFKTGIRRNELISLDVADINFENQSITLKPTAKRSNRVVFFDEEAEDYLRRWLRLREVRNVKKVPALFVTSRGRMNRMGIARVIQRPAIKLGLHDETSPDMEKHFSCHCCRHWFTTYLDRAGMNRRHIQFLRGDVGGEAIDIYIHNDLEKIRKEYLACIPRLGV